MMLLCRPWSRCITMRHVFNKCLRNQCSALRNNEREHVEPGGRPRWWQCPVDCWQGQALQVSACVLILVNYESCTLIFFFFFSYAVGPRSDSTHLWSQVWPWAQVFFLVRKRACSVIKMRSPGYSVLSAFNQTFSWCYVWALSSLMYASCDNGQRINLKKIYIYV